MTGKAVHRTHTEGNMQFIVCSRLCHILFHPSLSFARSTLSLSLLRLSFPLLRARARAYAYTLIRSLSLSPSISFSFTPSLNLFSTSSKEENDLQGYAGTAKETMKSQRTFVLQRAYTSAAKDESEEMYLFQVYG
jgi:hypothetical protein